MTEQILILDFGAQYTQVIARRVRECKVYSTIVRFDMPAAEIAALKPKGLILSGGPASVYSPKAPMPDRAIFDLGVPILGICYGVQLMAHFLGGKVGARRQNANMAKARFWSPIPPPPSSPICPTPCRSGIRTGTN